MCRKIIRDMADPRINSIRHIPIYEYSYMCKKCDDAENILSKKRIEEYKEEEILKKQNWIKQRDKLLKEDIK